MKLSQKALLLVALPLVFDIILLATLLNIVLGAEQNAVRADHAREVSTKADAIFEHLSQASLALAANTRSHILLGFKSIPPQIKEDVEQFKALCTTPDEVLIANKVEAMSDHILSLLEEDRERIANNSLEFPTGFNGTRQQMTALLFQMKRTVEQLYPSQKRQELTQSMLASRETIKMAIIFGFICNVFLALSLTVYFNRGTTRRLQALMDNTKSLAQGHELAPPLGGDDEIGKLDATFHEMAGKLKETERIKAEFTAMISHDLRSPLATMHTFLDLITSDFYGPTPPAELKQAKKVQALLDRLMLLIDDILSFERMDAGDIPLKLEELDIKSLLEESIHAVSAGASAGKVKFVLNATASIMVADRQLMNRALTNLLANAVKYSPEGEAIDITAADGGDKVSIEIRDRGPGIENEQKNVIFEKYRQAISPNTKEGTGLGLAICRKIIEQHNGIIGVRDADGGGSVFWLKVPKRPMSDQTPGTKAAVQAQTS